MIVSIFYEKQIARVNNKSHNKSQEHNQSCISYKSHEKALNVVSKKGKTSKDNTYLFKLSGAGYVIELRFNNISIFLVIVHHNTLTVEDFKQLKRPDLKSISRRLPKSCTPSKDPLQLLGKCSLNVEVPYTKRSVTASFLLYHKHPSLVVEPTKNLN